MNGRKRSPISTQTGGARILPHARYPSRPLTPHAQSSAYQDRWPRQKPRSLVVGQRCPQESLPISSQYGQRRNLRGQNRILDVPTKVSSLLHHEPGPHEIVIMNCREVNAKGTRTFQSATAVQVPSDSSSCQIFMRWSSEQVARRTP
jgi:hypothetical protein